MRHFGDGESGTGDPGAGDIQAANDFLAPFTTMTQVPVNIDTTAKSLFAQANSNTFAGLPITVWVLGGLGLALLLAPSGTGGRRR
jgi:hypothetical protein